MTINAADWTIEPPRPPFDVETFHASPHGVTRTVHAVYDTRTGETMAETPHAWAASIIAAALTATPRPADDTARHRAARESLRQRLTAPAAVIKSREVSR